MNEQGMDMKNRVFLITGGSSGVGKATALGLAGMGAKIVIVSRSAERGREAVNHIAQATGNDRAEVLVADLSLQSSIRKACDEFKRKYDNLHVLANLGGAVFFDSQNTAEGIERTFAVNYLSHFLLTNQLIDMLKESRPSRVITLVGAPRFLKKPTIDFEDLQSKQHFSGLRALARSMFAKMFFAFELARRLEGAGVTSVPFHPGAVKSNLLENTENIPWPIKAIGPFVNRMAKETCDIAVYLATAAEVEKVSGVFFDDKRRMLPLREKYEDSVGERLWLEAERLTGVSAARP